MNLQKRVRRAADAAYEQKPFVSFVDVLVGIGFVSEEQVEEWRRGGIPVLAQAANCSAEDFQQAFREWIWWAQSRGAKGVERPHAFRGPGGETLRVAEFNDPFHEGLMHGCVLGRGAGPRRGQTQARIQAPAARRGEAREKGKEPVVFAILRDSKCSGCGAELPRGSFLTMEKGAPLCLDCSDLGHLVFLPRGNTALSRRSREYSRLWAVVVKFSRSRGRYERQGILVEEEALEKAEQACLADADRRAAQRERAAVRRSAEDAVFEQEFTGKILELYPGCPDEEARAIAAHTVLRGSGRVGRSAAGRELEEEAVRLAVAAAVRHRHTGYDDWLMQGADRGDARQRAAPAIDAVLRRWERG